MWWTNCRWSPRAGRPNSGARWAAMSTWYRRAAPTPLTATCYGTSRNQRFNAANALLEPGSSSDASAIRGQPGRPGDQESHVLLRQFRAAGSEPVRPHHDLAGQCRGDQRTSPGRGLSRSAHLHRASIPTRFTTSNLFAKADHRFQRQGPVQHSLQPVSCRPASTRVARAG